MGLNLKGIHHFLSPSNNSFCSGVPSRFEQVEPKTDGKPGLVKVFWDKKAEDGSKIEVSETYNTVCAFHFFNAMQDF